MIWHIQEQPALLVSSCLSIPMFNASHDRGSGILCQDRLLPLSAILFVWLTGLSHGAAADDDFRDFETHIRPLLIQHCYECHSVESRNRSGGLLLDSQAGWETGGDRGPVVIPGDPQGSLLLKAVSYTDPNLKMPPAHQLSEAEVRHLQHWIAAGAPDPRDGASPEAPPVTDPSDPIAGRHHWWFRPLGDATAPEPDRQDWARQSLDRFVLARLESEQMTPAPDADPRTLVRRLYIQLTGIAPTPEETARFLSDQRPDAVALLVEELLESPRFGERWGRHWLDLARYADSNGLDENFLFREAWRYRNWVIDVLNADMPFDRFLLEQIAGDLLPADSTEEQDRLRIATGFLLIGPKVLLGVPRDRQKMEVADEQIDTIGRAILGQTLGCARCHDHKFDPFPTADYYALAGIFTSTQVMERRHMLGQQRVMERLAGLGDAGQERDDDYERYWRERPAVDARKKKAESALKALKAADEVAFQQVLKKSPDAVAEAAGTTESSQDQRIEAQQAFVESLAETLKNHVPIPPRAMIAAESDKPADEHIRIAGDYQSPDQQIPRGFLQVLSEHRMESTAIPEDQSGRRQLAEWLTDVEHGAGRLTARVLANRVWHHLMGQGIVRTVDNLGRTGDLPSHPELLDHLARRLIDHQWSLKRFIRDIVLSRTNAMSSRHHAEYQATDPDNRLLWRFHRRRLDPETLRDSMLSASGQLDLTPLDSTVAYLTDQATGVGNAVRRKTDYLNRSVYLPVIRNDLPELFDSFDFADPQRTTGRRPETTVAAQALFLMNDPMVMQASAATARRVLEYSADPNERIQRMFELIAGQQPDSVEFNLIRQFIDEARATSEQEDAELDAWTLACHSLFASSRFQILE